MARIAVGGSRSIESYDIVKNVLRCLLKEGDTILSGNAPGADRLGERFGHENGIEVKIIPSEWEPHGFKATMMRNEVLLKSADYVICFWDGESKGAKHMMEIALKARKLLAEVRPDGYLKLYLNARGI